MPLSPASGPGGGGGGFTPVTAVLSVNLLDIHAAGTHPLLWDQAFDDEWNLQPIGALPAGLGLTVALDGSSQSIDFDVAGTWAITFRLAAPPDATFVGFLEDSNLLAAVFAPPRGSGSVGAEALLTHVYKFPSGAGLTPYVSTSVAADSDPYQTTTCYAFITRLA